MVFRFHRSIRLLPGIRLNFGKHGVSTSIGVRGAHVTFGASGTRTTVGLPGTGLSYTHVDRSRHTLPVATTSQAASGPAALPGSKRPGVLWVGLAVAVLVVEIGRLTSPAPTAPVSTPQAVQSAAPVPAEAQAHARAAEVKRAALGVGQIRQAIANSNSLKLSRVTVMPDGAVCYRLHLQNSRGVEYLRTAVIDRTGLQVSGSIGFDGVWNRVCPSRGGRDITAELQNVESLAG